MIFHNNISPVKLRSLIRRQLILIGGNSKLKIYGKLNCRSGKRIKKENRVFFNSIDEALDQQFRPCAHCMYDDYKKWKHGLI
jgi:methylphosphotriester-DNA--protein-cysteine methyltransferase